MSEVLTTAVLQIATAESEGSDLSLVPWLYSELDKSWGRLGGFDRVTQKAAFGGVFGAVFGDSKGRFHGVICGLWGIVNTPDRGRWLR